MTDKEMAEKSFFFKELTYKVCRDERSYVDGFLAGLKAGRDMNVFTKWHDLRKDPNDLPKRDERFNTKVSVPVFSSKGNFVVYYFETKKWYCNGQKEEVIAWCELPKFKE